MGSYSLISFHIEVAIVAFFSPHSHPRMLGQSRHFRQAIQPLGHEMPDKRANQVWKVVPAPRRSADGNGGIIVSSERGNLRAELRAK